MAFHWFQKAAEKGNEKSMHELASCYTMVKGQRRTWEWPFTGFRRWQRRAMKGQCMILPHVTTMVKDREGLGNGLSLDSDFQIILLSQVEQMSLSQNLPGIFLAN
ncbi:unnamed protein product [Rhizophagus irregularis]|nr:unnamed protein product [Rhizophagus irregularis]